MFIPTRVSVDWKLYWYVLTNILVREEYQLAMLND